jgi:hypothetical protein
MSRFEQNSDDLRNAEALASFTYSFVHFVPVLSCTDLMVLTSLMTVSIINSRTKSITESCDPAW